MVVGEVWGDTAYHALLDYVFCFVIICLCIENKFGRKTMCKFFGNSTMRVSLMCLNLFSRNKYNCKLIYISL